MDTLPHPRASSLRLTAAEREVILTYNDELRAWSIYSDSTTMRGMVLRLARQLGAELRRVGDHGVEFEVPAEALRLTARRRGGGRGRPFTSAKSAGPASVEGKMAILAGDSRQR